MYPHRNVRVPLRPEAFRRLQRLSKAFSEPYAQVISRALAALELEIKTVNLKIPTRNPISGLVQYIEEYPHITERECAAIIEKRRVIAYVDSTLRLVSSVQNCSPGQKRDELARSMRDAAMQLAARANNLAIANRALNADCSAVFGGKPWEALPDEVFKLVAEFDQAAGDRETHLLQLKDRLVDLAVLFNDLAMVNIKARAESETAESLALPLEQVPIVVV